MFRAWSHETFLASDFLIEYKYDEQNQQQQNNRNENQSA